VSEALDMSLMDKLAGRKGDDESLPPTAEIALADAFVKKYAAWLRYVFDWNRWLLWDETDSRWLHEKTLRAFELAREICREAAIECKPASKALIASAKTVAAVERLAKADRKIAATVEQWDADPWLLNAHEYIDLRTGIGREADPNAYITKVTGCPCAPPGTPHPRWTAFLDKITAKNVELQGFLKRYIGYCLTGCTHEHVFAFGYGTGRNGKSTFLNTVAKVIGDYATTAPMTTFVMTRNEQHPTDLAKLAGARLVIAQENQKGQVWNETKIKQMTGGDTISARFMKGDFFDYDPAFKIFIVGNNKPRLVNVDVAIKARLLMLPFTVLIPEEERDPELMKKLVPEHSAILRWAVDGCLEWQRTGLNPPAIVRDFTNEYFEEQDFTKQWLDECTQDGGPNAFTRTKELYASWKSWCDGRGLVPGGINTFSETLSDKGITRKSIKGYPGFVGLIIRPSMPNDRTFSQTPDEYE
jgi:putative DNA primase/helicase